MNRNRALAGLLGLTLAAGCTGQISTDIGDNGGGSGAGASGGSGAKGPDPDITPTGAPVTKFECKAPASDLTVTPLRRLSALQYANSVRDLFSGVAGLDTAVVAKIGLDGMPPDDAKTTYAGMDANFSANHAQAYYDVADAVATAVSADNAKLTAVATACATVARPTAACVDGFLDGFATRAYRRPLTAAERARYQGLNDGVRDGKELFRSLVFSLLLAPQFYFHTEINGTDVTGAADTLTLSPYELASRLSYHFWQTMPDAELFAAAKDGSIATDAGFAGQVDRIFADPRTRKTVETFYAEWLRLGPNIPDFRRTTAFETFVAGSPVQDLAAGSDFLKAASDEITALTNHFTWDKDGSYKDLLMTDLNFTRSATVAKMYGVAPWDGAGDPPQLPSTERAGLLTRAAFLVSGTYETHPIHRGVVVRRRMLCDELAAPDPNSLPPNSLVPPATDANLTTRQRFENKVVNQPCAGCHAMMNPIGYVLERYDALGRYRDQENTFDDATGQQLSTLPIDSSSVPQISDGDTQTIDNAFDLSDKVANSGRTDACFARQYFRFTYHRGELESGGDACALEGVRAALAQGNLRAAFSAVATGPGFKTRKVQ